MLLGLNANKQQLRTGKSWLAPGGNVWTRINLPRLGSPWVVPIHSSLAAQESSAGRCQGPSYCSLETSQHVRDHQQEDNGAGEGGEALA